MALFPEKRFYTIAFGTVESSFLRGVRIRYAGGLGAGYKFIEKPGRFLSVTDAILYEQTNFSNGQSTTVLRNSTRLKGDFSFWKDKLTISFSSFLQPSLLVKNVRSNGNLTIATPLWKNLKLNTALNYTYESYVVQNRKHYDMTWTVGLIWGNM